MDISRETLTAGPYLGFEDHGTACWLAVPYATAERFAPAVQADAPRDAVDGSIDCSVPGPAAAQIPNPNAPDGGAENALIANIWAPATSSPEPRPVLLWIHGGAYIQGAANLYRGWELADRGDMVVVAINYRLGIFGFSDFSSRGVPTNLGLRDQIVAMQWVRDNIATFGGDPSRVTVAGESAGAVAISLHMLADEAKGLFAGAIVQSGAPTLTHDKATSEAFGRAALREMGLDPETATLEDMRAVPTADVIEAQHRLVLNAPSTVPMAPVLDGDLVPGSVDEVHATVMHDVPLLIGANAEEIRLFQMGGEIAMPIERDVVVERLTDSLGAEAAAEIASAYPSDPDGDTELATDANFAMPTWHVGERHAASSGRAAEYGVVAGAGVEAGDSGPGRTADSRHAYMYRMDAQGAIGAAHAIELTYLFPMDSAAMNQLRGGPLEGERAQLAERLRDHWVSFIRTGEPGPDWPAYVVDGRDGEDRLMLLMDVGADLVVSDPIHARREVWAGRDAHIMAVGPR